MDVWTKNSRLPHCGPAVSSHVLPLSALQTLERQQLDETTECTDNVCQL